MIVQLGSIISTCDSFPIQVEGGQKPYTVTFAPFGTAAPINITMGQNDDTLEWINKMLPDTRVMIAVSDRSVELDLLQRCH
jgi:hypothetical protein